MFVFLGCDFTKVTSIRCFLMEGNAYLAKSADLPCITSMELHMTKEITPLA